MENLIVTALQERAVDVNDWSQTCFALACCESDRVRFANTNIKELLGELFTHRFQLGSLAHRRGDHGNAFIRHLGSNRFSSVQGKRRQPITCLVNWLAFLFLERRRSVKEHRICGSRFVAVSFLGNTVQQHRAFHFSDPVSYTHLTLPTILLV